MRKEKKKKKKSVLGVPPLSLGNCLSPVFYIELQGLVAINHRSFNSIRVSSYHKLKIVHSLKCIYPQCLIGLESGSGEYDSKSEPLLNSMY